MLIGDGISYLIGTIQLRNQGLAVDKVAMALNDEGAKPRAGQQWHAISVYRVLKAAAAL